MRRTLVTVVAAMALSLTVAAPALAAADNTGAGGAGQDYGRHHAGMAQEMGGFSGDMNPGVHHQGFSNWDPTDPMP